MRSFAARAICARPTPSIRPLAHPLSMSIRFSSTSTATSDPLEPSAQPHSDSSATANISATGPAPHTTTITRNAPSAAQSSTSSRSYLINLTASNNYPVFPLTKSAGQSKFTLIKHVEGNKRAFIDDLAAGTGLPREDIKLQPVTGHVRIKGFHVETTKKWLAEAFGNPRRARTPVDAVAV